MQKFVQTGIDKHQAKEKAEDKLNVFYNYKICDDYSKLIRIMIQKPNIFNFMTQKNPLLYKYKTTDSGKIDLESILVQYQPLHSYWSRS